jgi:hypothetical protein
VKEAIPGRNCLEGWGRARGVVFVGVDGAVYGADLWGGDWRVG